MVEVAGGSGSGLALFKERMEVVLFTSCFLVSMEMILVRE
jgi:hypothetical protein